MASYRANKRVLSMLVGIRYEQRTYYVSRCSHYQAARCELLWDDRSCLESVLETTGKAICLVEFRMFYIDDFVCSGYHKLSISWVFIQSSQCCYEYMWKFYVISDLIWYSDAFQSYISTKIAVLMTIVIRLFSI